MLSASISLLFLAATVTASANGLSAAMATYTAAVERAHREFAQATRIVTTTLKTAFPKRAADKRLVIDLPDVNLLAEMQQPPLPELPLVRTGKLWTQDVILARDVVLKHSGGQNMAVTLAHVRTLQKTVILCQADFAAASSQIDAVNVQLSASNARLAMLAASICAFPSLRADDAYIEHWIELCAKELGGMAEAITDAHEPMRQAALLSADCLYWSSLLSTAANCVFQRISISNTAALPASSAISPSVENRTPDVHLKPAHIETDLSFADELSNSVRASAAASLNALKTETQLYEALHIKLASLRLDLHEYVQFSASLSYAIVWVKVNRTAARHCTEEREKVTLAEDLEKLKAIVETASTRLRHLFSKLHKTRELILQHSISLAAASAAVSHSLNHAQQLRRMYTELTAEEDCSMPDYLGKVDVHPEFTASLALPNCGSVAAAYATKKECLRNATRSGDDQRTALIAFDAVSATDAAALADKIKAADAAVQRHTQMLTAYAASRFGLYAALCAANNYPRGSTSD